MHLGGLADKQPYRKANEIILCSSLCCGLRKLFFVIRYVRLYLPSKQSGYEPIPWKVILKVPALETTVATKLGYSVLPAFHTYSISVPSGGIRV